MATLDTAKTGQDGQVVHPVLLNTAKDGSGTYLVPIVDADGHVQVDILSAVVTA